METITLILKDHYAKNVDPYSPLLVAMELVQKTISDLCEAASDIPPSDLPNA